MAQVMTGAEDQIGGLMVRATRKGEPWVLPADLLVTLSADVAAVGVYVNTGAITISRDGTKAGDANITATGGGLTSDAIPLTVEPGTADALVIDESGAVHA
jgi:hypothetical protein